MNQKMQFVPKVPYVPHKQFSISCKKVYFFATKWLNVYNPVLSTG